MTTVNIHPLPEWARKYPRRLWPGHGPIFTDGVPTQADRELARELWRALDSESQAWYHSSAWLVEPEPPKPRGRKPRTSSTS